MKAVTELEGLSKTNPAKINNKRLEFFNKNFTRVLTAGPVPIVVRGNLKVFVEIYAEADGKLELNEELSSTYSMEYGLTYDKDRSANHGWEVVKNFENNFTIDISGEAKTGLFAKVSLVPEFTLKFQELIGGGINLKLYLYADTEITGFFAYHEDTYNWATDASYSFTKLEGGGGIDLSLFAGLLIFDKTVIGWPNNKATITDSKTWDEITVLKQKKWAGIPEIFATPLSNLANSKNTRGYGIQGHYNNVVNPLFSKRPLLARPPTSGWTPV